jgi:pimeloyl-ACP methyl ester carboxylesterase
MLAETPMRGRLGRWLAALATLATLGLVAGCAGDDAATAASASGPSPGAVVGAIPPATILASKPGPDLVAAAGVSQATADKALAVAASLNWQLVRAGGVVQAVACTGSGAPTVVYLNGLLVPAAWTWPIIAQEQARSSRVCIFDRPGTGLSPARPAGAPAGPVAAADELRALMSALGETGPFVLVGWSYGGLVARVAAAKDPAGTAGLQLVEASLPEQYRTFDRQGWSEGGAQLDMAAGEKALAAEPSLTPKPVVVLQAGQEGSAIPGTPSEVGGLWTVGQRKAARLSSNSVYGVVTASAHQIPLQAPAAVLAATAAVVASTSNQNAPMPACPSSFAPAGIDCQ